MPDKQYRPSIEQKHIKQVAQKLLELDRKNGRMGQHPILVIDCDPILYNRYLEDAKDWIENEGLGILHGDDSMCANRR